MLIFTLRYLNKGLRQITVKSIRARVRSWEDCYPMTARGRQRSRRLWVHLLPCSWFNWQEARTKIPGPTDECFLPAQPRPPRSARLSPSTPASSVLDVGGTPPRGGETPWDLLKKKEKKLSKLSPRTESPSAGWMKRNQAKHIEMWPQKATKAGYKKLAACSHPARPTTTRKPVRRF